MKNASCIRHKVRICCFDITCPHQTLLTTNQKGSGQLYIAVTALNSARFQN